MPKYRSNAISLNANQRMQVAIDYSFGGYIDCSFIQRVVTKYPIIGIILPNIALNIQGFNQEEHENFIKQVISAASNPVATEKETWWNANLDRLLSFVQAYPDCR
jgi:hypothetical protein